MAIITRLTRLMSADLHGLLDRLETPDLVLAQALREMEESLDRERRYAARLDREIARLGDQEAELRQVLDQAGQALEDCLAAGQEDLARPVIRRQLEAEQQAAALRRRRMGLETERERRAQRIRDQESRLADLQARAVIQEQERDPEPVGPTASWSFNAPGVRDADVEVALLRAKRQRESVS